MVVETESTTMAFCSSSSCRTFTAGLSCISSSSTRSTAPATLSTAPKSSRSATRTLASKKGTISIPVGEKATFAPPTSPSSPVKLLTRVEQLKLLTKAEKAGLLSAAEKLGLSLSSIEKLGLLSKAEELGVLSAATDPATPSALFALSLGLLLAGPSFVYFVPEQYPWEVALQVAVALVCIAGGSAAFAASSLVSDLQKLK
uniref:Uncharacterized protein n=1 Tax=Kalanchoe fedtschenkoi TaxID=63787 RepID=A0A7N0ZVH2_KALFE